MKKRALVIGTGGLRGAYDAGVAATLCRKLGPDYFDAAYATSVGVYAATFFVANQPDTIENTWRNFVDGKKLVNFGNMLQGRAILDLEYLTKIFQNENSWLNVQAVFTANAFLMYVLTEYTSGRTRYVRPTPQNLFQLMTASTAIPLVHRAVDIDGDLYIDGGLSDPLPFAKALADGHDEVVVVYNKPKGFFVGSRYDTFSHLLAMGMPKQIAHLVRTLKCRFQEIEKGLEQEKRLKIIRPKVQLPLKSILDTNKARLNACVDMGIADAKEFLKTYNQT